MSKKELIDDDLDNLLDDDEEIEIPKSTKSKTKSKGKNASKSNKKAGLNDLLPPKVAQVLKLITIAVVCLIAGYVTGSISGNSKQAGYTGAKPVTSVKKQLTLEERADKIYTLQSDSLQSQFDSLLKNANSTYRAMEYKATIAKANTDVANTLNPFFNKLLAVKRFATEQELDIARKELSDYVEESASSNVLYDLLSGTTPAKVLESDGIKEASAVPLMYGTTGIAKEQIISYVVFVPFSTESKDYTVVYSVSMSANNKINSASFIGVLDGVESTAIYKQLNDSLQRIKQSDQDSTKDVTEDTAALKKQNEQEAKDAAEKSKALTGSTSSSSDE